eukprot:m.161347 g.161347  ORF g.161347 m.161347 type:complete len:550 (-) comp12063_c0_seq1:119-1768(-)
MSDEEPIMVDDVALLDSDGEGSAGYLEVPGAHTDETDADGEGSDGLMKTTDEVRDAQEMQCDDYCNAMLETIGLGRYQAFVLLLCGLANASDAIELMSISFLLSSTAQCDLNLTDERKGILTAAVFMGMIPGGMTFGILADRQGRRFWLGVGLVLNALGTLASSQSTSFSTFVWWRIVSGFGVGGSIPVLFSFILEFVPVWARGKMLVTVAFFWVIGTVICTSVAWGILSPGQCPTQADWVDSTNLTFSSDDASLPAYCAAIEAMGCSKYNGKPAWRAFMASCCAPAAMTTVLLLFATESPKWLVETNQPDRAVAVLQTMAKANGVTMSVGKPPRATKRAKVVPGGFQGLLVYLQPVFRTLKKPARAQFLWLAGVWFCLCFGFYGFRLWMTDFFAEGGVEDGTNIYAASFYVSLANIPGYLMAGKTIDWLGRKNTLIISMVMTGVTLFLILIVKHGNGPLIFSCIFAAVSAGAWCALDVLSVERFPTAIRSSALAMLTVVGRLSAILGTLVFGFLSGKDFLIPIMMTGIAFIGGAWCCKMLPQVKDAVA